jgi:hypothetical protein
MLSKRALERRANQNIAIDLKRFHYSGLYKSDKIYSGITVMAKSKWMNALHIRGNQGYKFVKRILCG